MARWDPEDVAGIRGLAALLLCAIIFGAALLAVETFMTWQFR